MSQNFEIKVFLLLLLDNGKIWIREAQNLRVPLLILGKHNMLLAFSVVQTCTGTRTLYSRTTATGTDSPRIGTTSPRSNTEETIHRAAGSGAFCSPRRKGER
jgi:hypothetical protein